MKRNIKKKYKAQAGFLKPLPGSENYNWMETESTFPGIPQVNPQQVNTKKRFMPEISLKDNPYLNSFNAAAVGITGLANAIQNNKLKRKEQFNIMQSLQPEYYQNMEGEGLNNLPMYTQYGGKKRAFGGLGFQPGFNPDTGSVDGGSGGTVNDDSLYEGIAHDDALYGEISIMPTGGGYVRTPYVKTPYVKRPYGGGPLTAEGAKEMLRDDSAHGHKLTAKQKRYFGWIAGGKKKPHKKEAGGSEYKIGQEIDLNEMEIEKLKKQGYEFEEMKPVNKEPKKEIKKNKFSITKK